MNSLSPIGDPSPGYLYNQVCKVMFLTPALSALLSPSTALRSSSVSKSSSSPIYSFIHSFIDSLVHSFTHLFSIGVDSEMPMFPPMVYNSLLFLIRFGAHIIPYLMLGEPFQAVFLRHLLHFCLNTFLLWGIIGYLRLI